jgi:hypothetical protein
MAPTGDALELLPEAAAGGGRAGARDGRRRWSGCCGGAPAAGLWSGSLAGDRHREWRVSWAGGAGGCMCEVGTNAYRCGVFLRISFWNVFQFDRVLYGRRHVQNNILQSVA